MTNASTEIENRLTRERLSRLSRFVVIAGVAWTIFAFDYSMHGSAACSLLCLIPAVASYVIYPLACGSLHERKVVANFYILINFIPLVGISLLTGQSQSFATLFLCCIGVFASHMIGIRSSLVWSVVSMVALVLVNSEFWLGKLPVLHEHTTFDKSLHCIGVTAVIFFFTWQAQHYFRVQSQELIGLTLSLEEKAEALRKLAQFDPLTDLFNRHSFHRQAQLSMVKAKEADGGMALLLLDLDGFKEINDTQGHQTGDAILQEIARRLKQFVDEEYLVARLGGDEFTVIVEDVTNVECVREYTIRLNQFLSRAYYRDGKEYNLRASIGAALYPNHTRNLEELLAFADTAMYKAKRGEQKVAIYKPAMTSELIHRRNLEKRLASALEAGEFHLFYQPQVSVQSGQVTGVEALLRWRKDGAWIPPQEFIGPLESTTDIRAVGRWALLEACKRGSEWHQQGRDIRVSVNVSSVQFQDPMILDIILEALETSQLTPSMLDLEITESLLIEDLSHISNVLFELRDLGVSLSVDDFGTGYSSLSYLRELPVTRLKIDRNFIKNIPATDDGLIARTIIGLGHNLDLTVLAEGVETKAQLDFLAAHRCDEYQGFLFSRPLPPDELDRKMRSTQLKGPKVSTGSAISI